jgi:hypothetical protein
MDMRALARSAALAVLLSLFMPVRARPAGLVAGNPWFYDSMANRPGFCVVEVDRYVVDFRVECTQPGWEAVIWEGLPRPGDYIDTLGANWVRVQAFYSFPAGVPPVAGRGVHVRFSDYPARWSRAQRVRRTNLIRSRNPDWDFSFRDVRKYFDPCLRRAEEANCQVKGPWGGPRFGRGGCRAAAGEWEWSGGGRVSLLADGTARGVSAGGRQANDGTWTCLDARTVTIDIAWSRGGFHDTLRLSPDGRRLEGRNQARMKVWAMRAQSRDFDECDEVVGAWKWSEGGRLVLDNRGGAQKFAPGRAGPGVPGNWQCLNGAPLTIRVTWGGRVLALTLSADGRRLEGSDELGRRVWGQRN